MAGGRVKRGKSMKGPVSLHETTAIELTAAVADERRYTFTDMGYALSEQLQ